MFEFIKKRFFKFPIEKPLAKFRHQVEKNFYTNRWFSLALRPTYASASTRAYPALLPQTNTGEVFHAWQLPKSLAAQYFP